MRCLPHFLAGKKVLTIFGRRRHYIGKIKFVDNPFNFLNYFDHSFDDWCFTKKILYEASKWCCCVVQSVEQQQQQVMVLLSFSPFCSFCSLRMRQIKTTRTTTNNNNNKEKTSCLRLFFSSPYFPVHSLHIHDTYMHVLYTYICIHVRLSMSGERTYAYHYVYYFRLSRFSRPSVCVLYYLLIKSLSD